MASTIDQVGNGSGYLYETDQSNNITASRLNTVDGIRDMLSSASVNAPLSASRGAIAKITVVDCNSVGAWSSVSVNGVNQIGGLINVTTNNPTYEAGVLAAAINAYTPGSGPDYTAYSIDEIVYLVEPDKSAGSVNGVTPVVSVTDVSIVTTVEAFSGGSTAGGSFDTQYGRFYWLDASPSATPNNISSALDITKYLTLRGMNTGMPGLSYRIASGQLTFINRYSTFITVDMLNEGAAASDSLDFINPEGFVLNDILFLQQGSASESQTVISAASSSNPFANIYLTGDTSFDSSDNAILQLKYTYDDTLGGIWREVGRSTPATSVVIGRNATLYVDLQFGDDSTAAREDFYPKIFQTADAALAVAQDGDTIIFSAGTYSVTSTLLAKNNFTVVLSSGTTLTGSTFLASGSGQNTKIIGNGNIVCTQDFVSTVPKNLYIECNNFEIRKFQLQSTDNLVINIKDTLTVHQYMILQTSNHLFNITWNRAHFDNSSALAGICCIGWNDLATDSKAYCKGDIYVKSNYKSVFQCGKATGFDYYPSWEGRVFVDAGITLDYVIQPSANVAVGGVNSPYRFKLKGEINCPNINTQIIRAIGGGQVEWEGTINAIYAINAIVTSDSDTGTLNIPSTVWLTNARLNCQTAKTKEIRLVDTQARVIMRNVEIMNANSIYSIDGDVPTCKYQALGAYSQTQQGKGPSANNEVGTPDIVNSTLMR